MRLLVLACLLALTSLAAYANSTRFTYDASGNTLSQQPAVASLPVIVTAPFDRLAEPGGNAGFSVNIVSVSPVAYQWQFNNADIPGATGDSFYLPTVTPTLEGNYRVVITNATGTVYSNPVTLSIDTNNNHLADAWELRYFGNLTQLPNGDYDGDSLSNLEEFENGTDPTVREVYYWKATSGDFNNPANWNRNRVPGVGDTAVINTGTFTLPPNVFISASQVTVNAAYVAPADTDVTLNISGSWVFAGTFTLVSGRTFVVSGSGTVTVTGTTDISAASFYTSYGATLSLPGITNYTQSAGSSVRWAAYHDGSKLIFPNLVTITGLAQPDRYLTIETNHGAGQVSLPVLTTITKADDGDQSPNSGVWFSAQNTSTISAPSLSVFQDNDSHPNSALNAYGSGAVLVPVLFAPKGVNIALTAASDPGHFTSLENAASLEITSGEVTMSNLTSIAGLSLYATSGATLSLPGITNYTQSAGSNVRWAAYHDGSKLIFPNLVTITGLAQPDRYLTIETNHGAGQVSLPVLTTITKADDGDQAPNSGVWFFAQNTSTISAPSLSVFQDNDSHPNSALNAYGSGAVLVPALRLSGTRGVLLNGVALSSTPFSRWQADNFTPAELADSRVSGLGVSLEAGGYPNLVRFALGFGPREMLPGNLLSQERLGGEWVVTYRRPAEDLGVIYRVQTSTDLVNWTTTGVVHQLRSSSAGFEVWEGRISSSAGSQFFRLQVTLP